MKTLILSALLCAVITLTRAAALSDAKDEGGEVAIIQEGEHHILERSTSCPRGWTKISDRCFLFVPRTMTWAQAERNCLSLGAHLASVRRAEEYHGIQRLIADKNYGNPLTWLGGFEDAKHLLRVTLRRREDNPPADNHQLLNQNHLHHDDADSVCTSLCRDRADQSC
ncbi:ladderlectin-like isoform X1 [Micropterus dolomieu]|uniref:ladderlectin-like isoform X1 n=1 Tax=Micropterus dolomieu TaxID=147949 RepID=UPI001E8CB6B9|nr:ladderlectin-like isoform X1 [Micropterus dolomieu]